MKKRKKTQVEDRTEDDSFRPITCCGEVSIATASRTVLLHMTTVERTAWMEGGRTILCFGGEGRDAQCCVALDPIQ